MNLPATPATGTPYTPFGGALMAGTRHVQAIGVQAMLLVLLTIVACRQDGLHSGRSSAPAPELLVISGAESVRSASVNGFQRLTYEVHKVYPASDVIFTIANHLKAHGYKPLRNNWFNRDDASDYVRGWVQYVGVPAPKAKGYFVCRWWAQWRNAGGEIVDYTLLYASKGETFTNQDRLSISASKMSPLIAERLRAGITANGPAVDLPDDAPPNAVTATDNSPNPRIDVGRSPGGV